MPQNGDSVTIAPTATEAAPNVSGMPAGMQLQDLTLVDSSLSGGDVTVAGNFSWNASQTSSTLAAPLTVEGDASFSGAGRENSQDPMTFDGTTEIKGPGVLLIQDSGPAVTNNGTLTLSPGATMQAGACCVTPDEFLNTGTMSMSTAGTATVTGMGFDDQGAVSAGQGSLLDVTAGVGEFGPGAGISGGGTLQFDLGAHQTLATGVSVAAGSTLTLAGNAELFGPGTLVGGGKFSWTGGTIDGSLDVAKTIHTTISGTATKTLTSPSSTPTALDLPRRHQRGRVRGGGADRDHHPQQPGHADDEDRHNGRGGRLLRVTRELQQQRHPHRGRRDRHRDHQLPAVQQQRHRQGQQRHTGDRQPRPTSRRRGPRNWRAGRSRQPSR